MKYLGYFAKVFQLVFKSVTTTIMTLIFIGSLFINGTLLLWQTGALAIGTALEVVTGIVSVATGLKDANDIFKGKNNALKTKNKKLVAGNKKLVTKVDDVRMKNAGLKQKNKKLVAKVDDVRAKNAGLKQRNKNLYKQNARLTQRKKNLYKQVGKVTDRVAKRTARVAIANAVSVPLEAMPYLSIFTVLGVTAMELTAACDTMKDMKEVNRLIENQTEVADVDKVCGLKRPDLSIYSFLEWYRQQH